MTLLIRVDASAEIGIGHLMRCLALAQAWQDEGGQAVFAMVEGGRQFAERLRDEGFSVRKIAAEVGSEEDARQLLQCAGQLGSRWVVVDGYRFGSVYQQTLKAGGVRQLFLDDCGHAENYCADLVLNQNLHADGSLYQQREASVELLLGLDYLLLRREFRNCFPVDQKTKEKVCNLLLSFGGSDPDNLTGRMLETLQKSDLPGLAIDAVIGVTNPHRSMLEGLVKNSRWPVRLLTGVADMTQLYRQTDLAISGGGSTLWELAYMGIPAVTLILAENQEPSSLQLDRYGSIRCLGYPDKLTDSAIITAVEGLCADAQHRCRMSALGRRLVDGQGALRVARLMRKRMTQGES